MKIAAPVSSVKEAEMLVSFGANELYCGFNPEKWHNKFKELWINRRDPLIANFNSWRELEGVVKIAHQNNIPVSITFNAPFYPQTTIGYLLNFIEKLVSKVAIDAVIVSDLNLIICLRGEKFPVRIHLSSLGSCFNSETVLFYHDLGVKRIILPRQLRLSEIKELTDKTKCNMEFEVFAVNDGCYYEEGFCQTSHAFGPFCMTDRKIENYEFAKKQSDPLELKNLKKLESGYLWYQNNCGCSYQADGLPNGPCSLCWFADFRDWGIDAVKIVGREASFYRKMRSLQMVKAVIDETEKGCDSKEISNFARVMRNTPEYCASGYLCYFR